MSSRGPLAGKTIVVTRSRAQAAALSDRLKALGASVIEIPSIEIVPIATEEVDATLARIPQYDWLLLTSTNAVEIVFDRLAALGFGAEHLRNVAVGVVGASTAERVRARGVEVEYVPKEYVGEALAAGLIDAGVNKKRVLLLRAAIAGTSLPEQLKDAGAEVDDIAVYETCLPRMDDDARERVIGSEVDCITFTSQSAVRNVVTALGMRPPARIQIACIGPVTAEAVCEAGMQVDILAQTYSIEGLVVALVSHLGGKEIDQA